MVGRGGRDRAAIKFMIQWLQQSSDEQVLKEGKLKYEVSAIKATIRSFQGALSSDLFWLSGRPSLFIYTVKCEFTRKVFEHIMLCQSDKRLLKLS